MAKGVTAINILLITFREANARKAEAQRTGSGNVRCRAHGTRFKIDTASVKGRHRNHGRRKHDEAHHFSSAA